MCVDRAGCFGADLARPLSNIPLHPTTLSYRPPLPPNARTPGHPAEKEEHHKCALAGPYPSVAAPQIYLGWRYPPSQPAHLSPPIGFLVNGPVSALHEDCRSWAFFADLWYLWYLIRQDKQLGQWARFWNFLEKMKWPVLIFLLFPVNTQFHEKVSQITLANGHLQKILETSKLFVGERGSNSGLKYSMLFFPSLKDSGGVKFYSC